MAVSRNDVETFLREAVAEFAGDKPLPEGDALLQASLIDDLQMDSLDFINLLFRIEQQFDLKIPEEEIDKHELVKFGALLDYIAAHA